MVLSGEDAFEKDLSKSSTLGRGKQGSKMDMMMMSDFALYLEDYLMHEHYYWDMSQYDPKFYLKINIGHCDIYFMVQ